MFKREPRLGSETRYRTYYRLHAGSLIYSKLFGWEGSVAIVPSDFHGLYVSSEFPTFELDTTRALPEFFAHLVRWPKLHEMMATATNGLGQRRQRVQIDEFLSIEVPLPSMAEQLRVSARLDHLASTIGRIEDLVRDEQAALSVLHQRLVLEESNVVALGEILTLDCAVENVEPGDEFQLAGVYGFGRGVFERGILRGVDTSYQKLHRLRAGQVVVSRLKAFEGAVAVVPPEFDGYVVSPEFPTFSVKETVHPGFMEMLCEWPGFRDLLGRASKGIGARRERVSANSFLAVPVPFPAVGRQVAVLATYLEVRRIRRLQEERKDLLDALMASALNQAFAGGG